MTIAFLATLVAVVSFVAAMVYAGVMDVVTMKISNWLSLFLLLGYATLAPLAGFGLEEIGFSVFAALMVFFVSIALFAMGWIGGGDGKLATVTALWMGADHTLQYVTYAALFGGVLTLALLLFRTLTLPKAWRVKVWVARLHSNEVGVPYGAALALAGLAVLRDTTWVSGLI